ncbi:MAG: hypothetical protein WC851_01775 [Candidatus Shapirobacteria bacterium]|jgi:hypothetical protein
MKQPSLDPIGITLIVIFLGLLTYAGVISYKSIDWTVLKRLESQTLVLPTPVVASPSAVTASPSAATQPLPTTK